MELHHFKLASLKGATYYNPASHQRRLLTWLAFNCLNHAARRQWCDPRLGTTLRGTQVCLAQMNCLLSWDFFSPDCQNKNFFFFFLLLFGHQFRCEKLWEWFKFDFFLILASQSETTLIIVFLSSIALLRILRQELFIFYQSISSQVQRCSTFFLHLHFKSSRVFF